MENLENLAIGDIVEIEFKRNIASQGYDQFKWTPDLVGYITNLPSGGYIGFSPEKPGHSKDEFQYGNKGSSYPISNMEKITILKKAIKESQDDGSGPLGRFRFSDEKRA